MKCKKFKKNGAVLEMTLKRRIVCVILASLFFSMLLVIKGSLESEGINEIRRPGYTEDSSKYNLDISIEGIDETVSTELSINPVLYTETEIIDVFEDIHNRIDRDMCGDNESIGDVRESLNFIDKYDDYPVDIEWYSSDYSVVDSDGNVYNSTFSENEERECIVTVVLSYLDYRTQYNFPIKVKNRLYSREEWLFRSVEKDINNRQSIDIYNDNLVLPENIEGKSIKYVKREETTSPWVGIMLGVIAIIIIVIGEKQRDRNKMNDRKEQLISDYSRIVSKLSLLMCAGMTVRKAWERIVHDYEKSCYDAHQIRYAYEEMKMALNQMESGISELEVYERFGQRCNTREYLQLSSLLSQNLRRGSRELIKLMNVEVQKSFDDRRNRVKQKGEEAGTKLLIPMIIMLIVVMIIVLVPVMSSFDV